MHKRAWLRATLVGMILPVAFLLAADDDERPSYVLQPDEDENGEVSAEDADRPVPKPEIGPRMDVVFLIDTTGSMGDEIEVVKEKMRDMVAEIASGDPPPRVRFGLVLYRDREDEYVTKTADLTDDIDETVAAIIDIQAGGGGDYPESLNEALHVAVADMNWDESEEVDKSVFLIADAPPHLDYEQDFDYKEEIQAALDQYIIIHTIGCSGLEDADAEIFREIAKGSEGQFNVLTYKREYVDADGETRVVLEAGGVHYALGEDAEAAAGRWRIGAEGLAEAGAAERIEVAAGPAAPGAMMGGYGGGGMGADRAMGAGMDADAVPASVDAGGAAENNLDSLLTATIRRQAEKRGVRYDDGDADTAELEVIDRYRGGSSGFKEALREVIRDEERWQELWTEHVSNRTPKPEPPEIDFKKNMAIVAFLGDKPSGGYAIKIVEARLSDDGERLLVTYEVTEPADDAIVTMGFTQPHDIIIVALVDAEVEFAEAE